MGKSVNWQNNEVYAIIKGKEKESGISFAEQNAAAGLSCHSIWGVVAVEGVLGAFGTLTTKLNSDNGDVEGTTKTTSRLKNIIADFDKAVASGNSSDIDKYLTQLEDLKEDNPDNRQIARAYETALKKKKNCA